MLDSGLGIAALRGVAGVLNTVAGVSASLSGVGDVGDCWDGSGKSLIAKLANFSCGPLTCLPIFKQTRSSKMRVISSKGVIMLIFMLFFGGPSGGVGILYMEEK